jgi:hypothetical protein
VSAKDISADDRKRLSGQIDGLYQKGSLSPKAFVEQVVQTVNRSTAAEPETTTMNAQDVNTAKD